MRASVTGRYLREALPIAALGGAVAAVVALSASGAWPPWAACGWLVSTGIGLAAGSGLARTHGRPGWGFIAALIAGILSRFVALAVGGVLAAWTGRGPVLGYVAGFAAGFVPLMVHEALFLWRASGGGRRGAVVG